MESVGTVGQQHSIGSPDISMMICIDYASGVSDVEVARGRHSETERLLSVTVASDGQLRAAPCDVADGQTFLGDLPPIACDPAVTGRWQHHKGPKYRFHAVVRHGLDAPLVLYCDAGGRVWLRPQHMIAETVVRDGRCCARFVRVDDD